MAKRGYRMKKNHVAMLLCISIASFCQTAFALELDISPKENGTLDVSAGHTFVWSDAFWSSISLSVENPVSVDESDGMYVATSGTSAEFSADLVGFRFRGFANIGLALNVLFNPSSIKEVGYVDLPDASRLFLINERRIELLLPRLKASAYGNLGPLRLSVEGEVSPWYTVSLTQTLTTSASGDPTVGTIESPGTGSWAASADGSIVIKGSFISPEVRFGFDSVPMAYDYLNAFGVQGSIDSLIVNLRLMGGASLSFLRSGGSAPRVLAGYEWNRVQDRSSGLWVVNDRSLLLSIGFAM